MQNSRPQDRHVTGIADMDEQHRYLYSLFDRMEETQQVTDKVVTKALLDEIERYIIYHFSCEEHLMRTYGVPEYAVHQSDHETASAKIVEFLDDFEAGTLAPVKMKIFLTGWLMEHSSLSDAEYAKWITARRIF